MKNSPKVVAITGAAGGQGQARAPRLQGPGAPGGVEGVARPAPRASWPMAPGS